MKRKAVGCVAGFLIAGRTFAILVAAVLGTYVWAWLSTVDSTIAPALIWRESDVERS
jgi:hypothetical protein